jgi:GNAT superfamily N-acetyltransferase
MNAVRRIRSSDAEIYKRLRLTALKDIPVAFTTTCESALIRTAESWSAQVEEAARGEDRGIFIAFCGQEPVGMAALYRDEENPHIGEVLQMWVSPPYRSQGVGQHLMDSIVNWARCCRFDELKAHVTRRNQRAIPFYEKCGFKQIPDLVFPPPNEIMLRRAI